MNQSSKIAAGIDITQPATIGVEACVSSGFADLQMAPENQKKSDYMVTPTGIEPVFQP